MRNKLITALFIVYILIFAVDSLVARDRVFSDMENRNLTQFPTVNAKAVLNGTFSEQFEKYMSDQIIGKDFLVKLKVTENLALGEKYINGVYFGKADMLIQEYSNPYNQLSKNLGYVNEFVDANPDLDYSWLIVPNACYIYSDRMPLYAECYNQGEVLGYILANASQDIKIVDCSKALMEHKSEYLYYRTDHHWTMHGAYIGYSVLCDALKITPTPEDDYDVELGSDSFYGTQYSNAPTFTQTPDDILLYNNPNGSYTVDYYDKDITMDSLYNMDNLEIKDKYTTYLDGNHPFIKITSNSSNKEKLLVVKDSYAHSLLPLLADNYSEIYVVDLRYYHQSVSELAKSLDISKVLFINNLEFLSTDDNFLWLN